MATTPKTPNDSGSDGGNAGAKPRATIVRKSSAGGSSPSIAPASPSPAGTSARVAPASSGSGGSSARIVPASGRASPAASARVSAAQIQANREALGLGTARPSENIKGLDEVAKRAEALAAREELKRKSGGKMNANLALHVDDTGARWKRNVLMGIIGAVLIGGAITGFLVWSANHDKVSARAAAEETRGILNGLEKHAELIKKFGDAENITVQAVKDRLTANLNEAMEEVRKQLKRDNESRRNPDPAAVEKRRFLEKLAAMKDGWKMPIEMKMAGKDDIEFSSKGKVDGASLEPVKVRVREGKAADDGAEKTDEKK